MGFCAEAFPATGAVVRVRIRGSERSSGNRRRRNSSVAGDCGSGRTGEGDGEACERFRVRVSRVRFGGFGTDEACVRG